LKSILTMVVLFGVIVVASYFAATRTRRSPEEERGYTGILMCTNPGCRGYNNPFPQRIVAGQPPGSAYRCINCQRMTGYRAVRCLGCGEIFPYIISQVPGGPESEQAEVPRCPECGSNESELVRSMEEVKQKEAQTK